jgi:hypothetical protein
MKRRALLAAVAGAILPLAAPLAVCAQDVPGTPAPDKGVFRILLEGAEVGTEQFETEASSGAWIVRSETVIRLPGSAETRSTGQLRLAADGTPVRYDWTAQAEKKTSGSVEFQKETAKTSIDLGGKEPYQQDFVFTSPRVAIMDNNLHHVWGVVLTALYNWSAKGQQAVPVLIPQDMTPGSITMESLGSKTVESSTFDALRVSTADLEVLFYFDSKKRLMRLEVPASNVVVVRR